MNHIKAKNEPAVHLKTEQLAPGIHPPVSVGLSEMREFKDLIDPSNVVDVVLTHS